MTCFVKCFVSAVAVVALLPACSQLKKLDKAEKFKKTNQSEKQSATLISSFSFKLSATSMLSPELRDKVVHYELLLLPQDCQGVETKIVGEYDAVAVAAKLTQGCDYKFGLRYGEKNDGDALDRVYLTNWDDFEQDAKVFSKELFSGKAAVAASVRLYPAAQAVELGVSAHESTTTNFAIKEESDVCIFVPDKYGGDIVKVECVPNEGAESETDHPACILEENGEMGDEE